MSKVYVLWACAEYAQSTIVGIFASEIGAKERLEQIERQLLSRPEWPDTETESEVDDAWKRLEKWREDNPDAFFCETSDTRQIEEFDLQGSQLPQDVEEFIEQQPGGIDDDDLRAWMSGHVRVPDRCEWAEEEYEDFWEGSCGARWSFIDGGPSDNKMNHCPQCGGKVVLNASKGE